MCVYIYIYTHKPPPRCRVSCERGRLPQASVCANLGGAPFSHARDETMSPTSGHVCFAIARPATFFKIHQRGVQRKQGVVMHMMLCTGLLYDTTPIRCTPLPLHPACNEYPAGRAAAREVSAARSATETISVVVLMY